jgi:hypothetical protein
VALIRLGYTQVYNLGGINDWPYEIVTKWLYREITGID